MDVRKEQRRKSLLRLANKLLSAFLVVLGFGSCGEEGIGSSADEYGTPYAEYEIKGKVKDTAQQPLKDMQVIVRGLVNRTPQYNEPYLNDTLTTDAEGNYLYQKSESFGSRLRVVWKDPQGIYKADSTELDMKFEGGDGWYRGEAKTKLDITMQKREEQPEQP